LVRVFKVGWPSRAKKTLDGNRDNGVKPETGKLVWAVDK
jgi:hypothetical protein